MQVGLHRFHADGIEWLRRAADEGEHTRSRLAHELCARIGATRKELCASARRVLSKLAGKLGIALPLARKRMPQKAPKRNLADLTLRCGPTGVGEVALEPVVGGTDKQRWRSMMETHHPQRWASPPGQQLDYWIVSSLHGWLGGIGFCAAGRHQKARDEFVGWSADAAPDRRLRHLRASGPSPRSSRTAQLCIVRGRVDPSTVINSDGWPGYNGLVDLGYGHFRIDHSRDEFTKGTVHGIEGFWGLVRLTKFKGLPRHTFHLHLKETE